MSTLLILLLLVAGPPAGALHDAQRLLEQGNELIAEGEVLGAIAAYEQALQTGWRSPALLVNLSAAALQAGDDGRARLYAERAARLAPSDPDAAHNLALARRAAGESAPRPPTATGAAVAWTASRVGAGAVLWMALVLWLVLCGMVALRFWRPSALLRRATLVMAPLAIAALALAAAVAHDEAASRGVVMVEEAVVRSAPDLNASTTTTIGAGELLRTRRTRGTWREVRLPDGATGWVDAGALEEV